MKNLFYLFILIFIFPVFAEDELTPADIRLISNTLESVEREGAMQGILRPCDSANQTGLSDSFSIQGADCSKFITDNGEYGEYGLILKEALEEKGRDSHMYADDRPGMEDSPYTCPAWKSLSYEMRLRFWVWTFASIAWDESRCNHRARNPNATNGTAIGLLQLDQARSARRWRGVNCEPKDISPPRNNLRCGVDIMEELMRGKDGVYKASGKLWGDTSYWEKLKRRPNIKNPSAVASRILEFPACQVRSKETNNQEN